MRDFGRCIAQRSARAGQALLATVPGSTAERGAIRRLDARAETCMRADVLSEPAVRLRGAVAEGFLAGPLGGASLKPVAAAPLFGAGDASVTPSRARANEAIYAMGQCVVTAQPTTVRTLAGTPPATPAERAVFRDLRPALSPCLPNDQALRLDRPTLRAVLAESLYMLTASRE